MAAIVKTVGGLALASVKTFNGLASASLKTICGQDATSGGGGTEWVTAVTPGTARNDFGDNIGLRFTTGATPPTVTHLGRWVIAGNSGTHVVSLYESGSVVASVTVNTSGAPAGAFTYVALGSPVTLLANTTYFLVSAEANGGDQWYNDNCALTVTADLTLQGSAYGTPPGFNNAGQIAFGPPSLKY